MYTIEKFTYPNELILDVSLNANDLNVYKFIRHMMNWSGTCHVGNDFISFASYKLNLSVEDVAQSIKNLINRKHLEHFTRENTPVVEICLSELEKNKPKCSVIDIFNLVSPFKY